MDTPQAVMTTGAPAVLKHSNKSIIMRENLLGKGLMSCRNTFETWNWVRALLRCLRKGIFLRKCKTTISRYVPIFFWHWTINNWKYFSSTILIMDQRNPNLTIMLSSPLMTGEKNWEEYKKTKDDQGNELGKTPKICWDDRGVCLITSFKQNNQY